MITTSLDIISRRWLLEQGYPIHYYLEALLHSQTCLRELIFDVLKIVNAANLVADDTGNIFLPNDFVEDIAVTLPAGQSLRPLPQQDWITPLRIHDATSGGFVPYAGLTSNATDSFLGFPLSWNWWWNVNSWGESTGQQYGVGGGTKSGYSVFKTQRRIQLSEDLANASVVLLYIGDGTSIDSATQIDPQAWSCINSFIQWKRSANRDNKDSAEGRNFYNERRKLVARLSDVDIATLKNILHQNFHASIKN